MSILFRYWRITIRTACSGNVAYSASSVHERSCSCLNGQRRNIPHISNSLSESLSCWWVSLHILHITSCQTPTSFLQSYLSILQSKSLLLAVVISSWNVSRVSHKSGYFWPTLNAAAVSPSFTDFSSCKSSATDVLLTSPLTRRRSVSSRRSDCGYLRQPRQSYQLPSLQRHRFHWSYHH